MYLRARAWLSSDADPAMLQGSHVPGPCRSGLEAKANRDCRIARPTACSGGPGRIVRFLHTCPPGGSSPWTKQPLNLSLETQETSFESSYCSQAKRAVSSSRRRLRSILIRGRGAAGKLVPPGSLADLAGRLTAQRRRPSRGRVTSAERKTQAHRLVEHGDGALVVDICCVLDQVPRVAC